MKIALLYGLSLISWTVFGTSLFLQHFFGLEPCLLCMMQRYTLLLLAMAFTVWVWRAIRCGKLWSTPLASITAILTGFGLYFSYRQLWLQSLPPEQVPACMPSLSVMLDFLPWQTILKSMMFGTGDCAEQGFLLVGLSLAAWACLYFSGIALILVGMFYGAHKKTH